MAKKTYSESEKLRKEIKVITKRIKSLMSKYRKKYYTVMPDNIKLEILNNLISVQKVLTTYDFLINFELEEFEDVKKSIKSKYFYNQLVHACRLIRKYYNYDVAYEVDKILGSFIRQIRNNFKSSEIDLIGLSNKESIIESIQEIARNNILLSYIIQDISVPDEVYYLIEIYNDIDVMDFKMYELSGIKKILENFEDSLNNKMKELSSSERNILLDYIKSNINFDTIIEYIER